MKTKVLVIVSGGVAQGAYACGEEVDIAVLDYDNADGPDDAQAEAAVWFEDGQTASRFLQQVALGNENYKTLF